ncbi:alpha/beta fold hydrolase [Alkalihalobacillus sp. AL-G]|uniref:alpha/beta fold hydrolase n=1 Tax=Alkalihalobacillus sp. AL-G TaxID=2926399 RepID=UPI00272B14C3|nr:alpha/beta fold hydrolase [Alkalihalobacillus sp. AL-G]WLD92657.1 alpha/beta fold hydrolase [Alkalihalobacillus sp. AL-G]
MFYKHRLLKITCIITLIMGLLTSYIGIDSVQAEGITNQQTSSYDSLMSIINSVKEDQNWMSKKNNGETNGQLIERLENEIAVHEELNINRVTDQDFFPLLGEFIERLDSNEQKLEVLEIAILLNENLLKDMLFVMSYQDKNSNKFKKEAQNKLDNAVHHYEKNHVKQSIKKIEGSTNAIFKSFSEHNFNYKLEKDDDQEGLYNLEEIVLKTNPLSKDTDGDGLNDYIETYSYSLNPLLVDSNGNGVNDGQEDTDEDRLVNIQEQKYGTSLENEDTDSDTLTDGYEVQRNLDPLSMDTDNDKLKDGNELKLNTDPLNEDSNGNGVLDGDENYEITIKTPEDQQDETVKPSVTMKSKGEQGFSTTITNMEGESVLLGNDIPGYLGAPYEFNTEANFDEATISFEYSNEFADLEGSDFVPAVYYFNEFTGLLEKVDNQVIDYENNTVHATVEHFSQYILLNQVKWDETWNKEFGRGSRDSGENDEIEYIDIVFAIDSSGSMQWNDPEDLRKTAVKNFVDRLLENDQAAVVDFDSNAEVKVELTTDKQKVKIGVDTIDSSGGTNIYYAVNASINELLQRGTNSKKYILLLTDGEGYYNNYATQRAIDNNITIYTIGLGSGVDDNLLKHIAEETEGKYYFASNPHDLLDRYDDVADDTTAPFKDTDGDGLSDHEEENGFRLANGTVLKTDSTNSDTDNDTIPDGFEVGELVNVPGYGNMYLFISNPLKQDTDNDGMTDDIEIQPLLKFDYDKNVFVENEYNNALWYDSDAVDYTIPLLFVHGLGGSEGTFKDFVQYIDKSYTQDHNIRHFVAESVNVSTSGLISFEHPDASTGIVQHTSRVTGKQADVGHGTPTISLEFKNSKAHFQSQGVWVKNVVDSIHSKFGNKKINIVGHSMGGIATSYYMYDNPSTPVDTFVTLGTPFKGSGFAYMAFSDAERDLRPNSDAIKRLQNPLPSRVDMMSIAGYGDYEPPAPVPKSKAYYLSSGDGIVSVESALGANHNRKVDVLVDGYHTKLWAPIIGNLPYSINNEKDNIKIIMDFIYYNRIPPKNKYGVSATTHNSIN